MDGTSDFKSFYIYGRFCPRRNLEASKLYRYLIANNLKEAANQKNADLIIIFTCGVFKKTEDASFLTIEKSLKNKHAKIVITGCLTKICPSKLKIFKKAIIIQPENLGEMDSLIQAKLPFKAFDNGGTIVGIHPLYESSFQRIKNLVEGIATLFMNINWSLNPHSLNKTRNRLTTVELFQAATTYKIEIARGCLSNCTFCAIKLAMGKFHSFPEEQILRNFKSGLQKGYKDFVLIAGDIGCYGMDKGTNLPALLKKIFALKGDFKILLWDFNARWFVKYFEDFREVLKANSERISRMVIPIESASNRILRLRNRGYEIERVKECLLDLQKAIPSVKIDTQIVVGFPGETNEDFLKSLELIKEISFSEVAVFKYDNRPYTKASKFSNQVAKKTINQRAKVLLKTGATLAN